MKPDSFEQKLQRQPLRTLPPSWRVEILRSARDAAPASAETGPGLAGWRALLGEWLWPSGPAWGTLAAMWVAIFAFNLASREAAPTVEVATRQPAATVAAMSFVERNRMLENLLGLPSQLPPAPVSPPKELPRPRSRLQLRCAMA